MSDLDPAEKAQADLQAASARIVERPKYVGIGASILISAAMVGLSLAFALVTALNVALWVALPLAFAWGVVALSLNRLFVVSLPRRGARRTQLFRIAERRIKIPTTAAIATITIGSTLYLARALDLPEPVTNVLFWVTICCMLAIPVAFLVAVIRRYLSRSALTQVLISLGNSPTTRQVTAALREGLRDPGLRILWWSEDERSYLDESRQPVADIRREAGDRLVAEIRSSTETA